MAGYHTGPSAYAGFLIGSRHSHLDSAGYSIDEEAAATGKEPSTKEVVDSLIEEEAWRQILSSLVTCFFARKIYTPKLVAKAFRSFGREFTEDDLRMRGKKTLHEKYEFKVREGFSLKTLRIPERITQTPTPQKGVSPETLATCLKLAETKLQSL
jgi:aldehyde:ferredoxin oxidoreductase